MKLPELERRLTALEKSVEELQAQARNAADPARPWWRDGKSFANDPVFEEIVRLGREYRESLRPRNQKYKQRPAKTRAKVRVNRDHP